VRLIDSVPNSQLWCHLWLDVHAWQPSRKEHQFVWWGCCLLPLLGVFPGKEHQFVFHGGTRVLCSANKSTGDKRKVLAGGGLGQMVGKWRIRASPAALNMWSSRAKWDEEKLKYAGLAQGDRFGSS
jgi:hypothetical protein